MLQNHVPRNIPKDRPFLVKAVSNPRTESTKMAKENADCHSILTETLAAQFLGVSVRTLQKRRFERKAPPYIKIGRSVRYSIEDLNAFLQSHRIDSSMAA